MRVMLGLTLLSVSIYTNRVRQRHIKKAKKKKLFWCIKRKTRYVETFKKNPERYI